MARRTGVSAEETRDLLLAAAAEEFAEHGYDGARVSAIARAAGLTTGAIYAHFDTKAALLLEALRSHSAPAMASLMAEGAAPSVLELLRRAGRQLPGRVGRRRARTALLLEAVTAGRRDRRLGAVLAANLARRETAMARLVERAQAEGEVDDELSPAGLARLVTLIAMGALVVGALDLQSVDPAEWAGLIDRVVDAARAGEGR